MFVILATKPLNDGTKGRRFNILGQKGFFRLRKNTSRGWFKNEVCLLYTSPSPRDAHESRMPSSA